MNTFDDKEASHVSDHLENEFELSNEEMHLYSRQILLDGWDIEAQEKLKLANVLIIGAGGIGCTSAELLARAGVGKITIVDADTIEMSNLQRQIAFTTKDLGRYKAEILAKHLKDINPHIQVSYQNIRFDETNADELVQHQDVVLDGCDNFTTRYLVNACVENIKYRLSVRQPLVLKGNCLWWMLIQLVMNACFRKKIMPMKGYVVRSQVY
jgi:adenylyltransferase/sulfurtransferase